MQELFVTVLFEMRKHFFKFFLICEIFLVFVKQCAKKFMKKLASCENCKDFVKNMRNFSENFLRDATLFMVFQKLYAKKNNFFYMQMQIMKQFDVKKLLI